MVAFEAVKENKIGLDFFSYSIKLASTSPTRERKDKTKHNKNKNIMGITSLLLQVQIPQNTPQGVLPDDSWQSFAKDFIVFKVKCFISLNSQLTLWGFIIPTLKMRKHIIKTEQDAIPPRVKHIELRSFRLREFLLLISFLGFVSLCKLT